MMDRILYARLLISSLGLIQFGAIFLFFGYWDLFPRYSVTRIVGWFIYSIVMVSVLIIQILSYRHITSSKLTNDSVFAMIVISEGILCFALMIYLKVRSSRRGRVR